MGEGYCPGGVGQLAHGTQCIAKEVFSCASCLRYSAVAVEIGVCVISKNLRETGIEIKGVINAVLLVAVSWTVNYMMFL